MAAPRSESATILSKMRRWASRKKSRASITSAARLNASLCSRIAPRTDRSASRLCGSVRSATIVSATLFRHHFHLDGRRDVTVELHRHLHLADLLDRVGELQLAPIDI